MQTVQGHAEVTQLHGGVEGHAFHMHVITLHELGVAQWGMGRGAEVAASINAH